MFIAPSQLNVRPAKYTKTREDAPPHFGAVGTEAAKQGSQIAYLGFAKGVQRVFKHGTGDVRVGGLSLEDMAGRLLTLIGLYIPQGYFACRDDIHPWETNGRNAVVWTMTLALTSLIKSENHGVNTLLLNPWMQQKGAAVRFAPFLRPLVDLGRMDVDYQEILKKAGIELSTKESEDATKGTKALWASSWLDANRTAQIENYFEELQAKERKALETGVKEAANEALTTQEQRLQKAIPQFFRKINLFNMVSTGIITGLTVYFIGGVAMKIVNKLFTPLDKKSDAAKPKPKPKPIKPPNMPYPPQYGYNPRLTQPQPYQYGRRYY